MIKCNDDGTVTYMGLSEGAKKILGISPKLTGWYSGDQKPTKNGVYERDHGVCSMYAYFDGLNFGVAHCFVDKAYTAPGAPWHYQDLPWRGIQGEEA